MLASKPNGRQTVGQVVIGTAIGLSHDAVEFNKRDIVIVPKATDAHQYYAQLALTTVSPRFRLFAMLPTDRTLAPYERDWVTATFGFDEVTIPRHGYVPRPVRVVFARIANGLPPPSDVSLLELKRIAIGQHPIRNRLIARVAKVMRAANYSWLREHVPGTVPIIEGGLTGRVAVLVENIDHSLALAERLRDWPLVTGDDVIQHGLSGTQRRVLAERQAQPNGTGPCIATVAGLAKRQWTRYRQVAYLDAGWLPPGLDPVVNRIESFLASRPEPRRAT